MAKCTFPPIFYTLTVALCGFVSAQLNAQTITFDGQAVPGGEIIDLTTYSEAGFNITASTAFRILDNQYYDLPNGGLPGAGGFAFGQYDETILTFTHAAPFSFNSFEGGATFGNSGGDVRVTGIFVGGGTI